MTRRGAVGALVGMSLRAAQAPVVAVVLDAKSGKPIEERGGAASLTVAAPGSTVKPLILAALLESGKLLERETVHCSGQLLIQKRSFACVHPHLNTPIDLPTAIAYSCNEYVAKMAQRFTANEQANALRRYGLGARVVGDSTLQALGEDGIEVTVSELAAAYRRLTAAPIAIRKGLEDAIEFGTGQKARVAGITVAGKTGSSGNGRWAWFAGFAPSVDPRFIVAVRTQGSSGGADAAPIAAELLSAAFRRHA